MMILVEVLHFRSPSSWSQGYQLKEKPGILVPVQVKTKHPGFLRLFMG
jgi:hypothetical protein